MFWKNKANKSKNNYPKTPANTVIYAIGDIHGYANLLTKMHKEIEKDSSHFELKNKIVIYIGDYIDRGLQSKEVIDILIDNPLKDFKKIYLKGNHEQAMLDFLENPESGDNWMFWGGKATIGSYGVVVNKKQDKKNRLKNLSKELNNAIPTEHKKFFNNLLLNHTEGDYFFVHAGIRPEVAIDKQKESDMLTIREEFIYSSKILDKTIVFGHTIFDKPFNRNGRIGIDTGAYAHGNLTCAVLEDEKIKFLTVS